MKKILLLCSAGMSTSFLVKKMTDYAKQNSIDVEIEAVPVAESSNYVGKVDIVLLGPQVKYLYEKTKEEFSPTPVSVINMVDYGAMKADKILQEALKTLQ